ncbi:MAG: hypothetical protein NW208_08020 [Bryobacter sp.]|nr:hypothetical protein [Bryobacter sp.]
MKQVWMAAAVVSCGWAGTVLEEYRIVSARNTVEKNLVEVRPGETLALQVRAYGRLEQAGEEPQQGRIEHTKWEARILEAGGGKLSKPFKYQGEDTETVLQEKTSAFAAILRAGAGRFLAKDAVLYNAPLEPGTYTVEVAATEGGDVKASVKVRVTPTAPSSWTQPKNLFGEEPLDTSPYRYLCEHYAPFVAQETWFDPRADYLHRFDFDGDRHGDNNWDNLEYGSPQAYVYYAAMETETHWFLHYNFFHARDYSDNCLAGMCHENDNEGIVLTVKKDGSEFGRLEVMETLAHNNVYTYTNRRDLRKGLHNVDGPLVLVEESHPVVFLEAGGHGALGGGDRKSTYDAEKGEWKADTGVTYFYRGVAEMPKSSLAQQVGYELLPIEEHWWKRHAEEREGSRQMFADYEEYRPVGNRPRPRDPRLATAFLGEKHSSNKARPFWGWTDTAGKRRKVYATGQWALDPAYSLRQSLRFPADEEWSFEYVYNPFLDIVRKPE